MLGLGQEMYKMILEHFMVLESKKVLKDKIKQGNKIKKNPERPQRWWQVNQIQEPNESVHNGSAKAELRNKVN